MASHFCLRSSSFCNPNAVLSEERLTLNSNLPSASKIYVKEPERHRLAENSLPIQLFLRHVSTSQIPKWISPGALSSIAAAMSGSIFEDDCPLAKPQGNLLEFNRVDYLVWVLHESARSFSDAMQKLELGRMPLAMAWNGVDVDAWHKRMAYRVALYALLKVATEVELFLSHNSSNYLSPVNEILSPSTKFLQDHIESQLNTKNPKLLEWFQMVELPRLTGFFMPLLKKWSAEYAGSGIAGTAMAITCSAAIENLCSARIQCYIFSNLIEQALIELMTMAHDLVSLDKLHCLAIEAGVEEYFLSHFGSKVLPSKKSEDIEFWIGLVYRKLYVALERESVIRGRLNLSDKVQQKGLATLALFAYLGRESRLFLSRHKITDIDDHIKDFLSYLECGILFIYPEFSTISVYQLLMEVTIDEIRWLDLFAAYNCNPCQEGKRSKSHPNQAEKEIFFYTVFTVYNDVISGFAHYTSSTQQTLDSDLLEFLLQSQGLLSACLDEHWAAYDITTDLPKIGERNGPGSAPSLVMDAWQKLDEYINREKKHKKASPLTEATSLSGAQAETSSDLGHSKSKSDKQNFLRKSAKKLVAASVDVWMGTHLLFIDISETFRFIVKRCCGHYVTERENRKMQRTFTDLATLIPVTILMLLPVSAVGHAAMFAAIKRYVPCLIPSPFSDERINLVKQLKRTKKMEVEHVNVEEAISKLV